MKKALALILVLCLALSLVACGGNTAAEKKEDITIAFAGSIIAGNEMYTGVVAACTEIAKAEGVKYVTHDAQMNEAEQIKGIENFIAQQVDVIIIDAINPASLEPYIQEAMNAGIGIIASGVELQSYDVFCCVDQKLTGIVAAEEAVKWINEKLGGEAKIGYLSSESNVNLIEREVGYDEVLEAAGMLDNVVANLAAETVEQGMKQTENMLQANPDIKVIIAGSEDAAFGALEAVKGMGLATEDFGIFTINGTDSAIQMIKDGEVLRCTVRFQFEKIPEDNMSAALALARGEEIDKIKQVSVEAVTIENASNFVG